MKKLPLTIVNKSERNADELMHLKRCYSTILFDECRFSDGQLFRSLEKFAPSAFYVNKVYIVDETLATCMDANEKLAWPVIFKILSGQFRNVVAAPIPSLKSLSVTNSSWSVLQLLSSCKNFRQLAIKAPPKDWLNLENDTKYLTALMAGQEKLETLVITNYFPLDIDTVVDVEYNLKQLSVRHHAKLSRLGEIEANTRLIQIMERHKNTLENLEICVKGEHFMAYIMKNLKVKRLYITASLLPTNLLNDGKVKPNLHLKKLIIGGQIKNIQPLNHLLENYPKIDSLIIKNWDEKIVNEALIIVSRNLSNLTFLHIPTVEVNETRIPLMPSLRTLHVDYLSGIDFFLEFCSSIPSIEHLAIRSFPPEAFSVKNISLLSSRLFFLLTIKFGREFEIPVEMIDIFRKNCPRLPSIEIYTDKKNPKQNITRGKIEVVYFTKDLAERDSFNEKTLWERNQFYDDE